MEQIKLNAPGHKGEVIDNCDPNWTLEEQLQEAVKEGFLLLNNTKDNKNNIIKNPVLKDNITIPTEDNEKNPFINTHLDSGIHAYHCLVLRDAIMYCPSLSV